MRAVSTDLLEGEDQLAALRAVGDAAATGRGRLVVVSAEAGVGKTALVRSFCELDSGSRRVLWGACDALFTPRRRGASTERAPSAGPASVDPRHHTGRLTARDLEVLLSWRTVSGTRTSPAASSSHVVRLTTTSPRSSASWARAPGGEAVVAADRTGLLEDR
jgi:hypothetical protein